MLLLEDKRFYTYAYLDTRKPGQFKYNGYQFDFEPFYIGKGKADRYIQHLEKVYKNKNLRNHWLLSKIKKIIATGNDPKIMIVKENLTQRQAFDLEIELIGLIGRKIMRGEGKRGPLVNHTPGGEGTSYMSEETRSKLKFASANFRHSDKSKEKMSKAKKDKTYEEIYGTEVAQNKKLNHSKHMMSENNSFYGKHHSDKTKNHISKTKKENLKNMTLEERLRRTGHSKGKKYYYNSKMNEFRMLLDKDVTSDWQKAHRTFSEKHKESISKGKKEWFKKWNEKKKLDKNLKYCEHTKDYKERMSNSIKEWWKRRKLEEK
jgi:NUMOD3 motif